VNLNDLPEAAGRETDGADLLSPLLRGTARTEGDETRHADNARPALIPGVVVGKLLAIVDEGRTPLVGFGVQGEAAVPARTVVDLHGAHIGHGVVMQFEEGDPSRPIVMGVLRGGPGWPLPERPAQVEVDADGQRLLVSAREQLVLRCGKASITLTKAGKVLVEGSYLLSRSTGVNRVKGGSVQLN
jgi:hypothetical protein